MDWLTSFGDKFKEDENLKHLKRDRFHGKVIINFADGESHNAKIEMNIKPSSTLTKGE